MRFVLPVPPDELHPNKQSRAKGFQQKRTALKQSYQLDAGMVVRDEKRKYENIIPASQVVLQATFNLRTNQQHDKDNLTAWLKHVIDILQIEKVVENDKHVLVKPPRQKFATVPTLELMLFVIDDEARVFIETFWEAVEDGISSKSEFLWFKGVFEIFG